MKCHLLFKTDAITTLYIAFSEAVFEDRHVVL